MEIFSVGLGSSKLIHHVFKWNICPSLDVFTLPNMPSYARLFRGTFTLPEVNCLLELAPQFTLPDPTHIGGLGLILM